MDSRKTDIGSSSFASIENVKYYSVHNYLQNHWQNKKEVTWISPEGDSVVLMGSVEENVVEKAMKHLPNAVFCGHDTTVKQLIESLTKCEELDDIHCMEGGRSITRIRLNSTCYSQPRRISRSLELGPAYHDYASGTSVRDLFSYSQSYCKPEDW